MLRRRKKKKSVKAGSSPELKGLGCQISKSTYLAMKRHLVQMEISGDSVTQGQFIDAAVSEKIERDQ